MKYCFLFICLIFKTITFSQNTFKFKSGGAVLQNNVKISSDSIRILFNSNQKALELYNIGRTKKTVGNILLYGGIGALIGKTIYDITFYPKVTGTKPDGFSIDPYNNITIGATSRYESNPSPTLYFVAGAMIIAAIPVKIGFSNKIRQAINLANQDFTNPKTTQISSTDIIANSNGIGFSITF